VPFTVLAFLAEPSAAPTPNFSRTDRSAEAMQRLRHPFQTQPDRDTDDPMLGSAR
jgi:hypothetical protein